MASFKRGDKVEWKTSQGSTRGTVVGTVTSETHVKGYVAKASPEHPEVEVRSAKSGKHAVHGAGALRKAR
jgi:redox-regulated HSP33 family molecular chaperone